LARALKGNPTLCYIFCSILLSMAGVPPFAGFFAKLDIFIVLINEEQYLIALF
jgi:NADH:ubiquinone oxidoreductase subunit 2 (subunit N)